VTERAKKKRLYVGRFAYTIVETDTQDAAAVIASIQAAVETPAVVAVEVLDENDRQLTLYLNGRVLDAWAIDLGKGPKPTEYS
jgi:hypothetical protein